MGERPACAVSGCADVESVEVKVRAKGLILRARVCHSHSAALRQKPTSVLPRLEEWVCYTRPGDSKTGRAVWRVYCPDCPWSSGDLPFKAPDDALHAHTLHKVLCEAKENHL